MFAFKPTQAVWWRFACLCLLTPPVFAAANSSDSIRGTTHCAADLSLAFPLTGRIAEAPVQEGSLVKTGQLLMSLDRAAEQLDMERRKVQWQSRAEIQNAEARKATAEQQLQAARNVYQASGGISREELENRELAFQTTTAELARLKTVKEMERLDYLTAKENVERRILRAPSQGIVTKLIKQKGESAQANEAIVKLCDLSRILFVSNVPAAKATSLQTGKEISLLVGGHKTKARITFVSPVVDAASGLREVKAELIKPTKEIQPGMAATFDLTN